jgi:acyl-coenzyme A thioesterase PaaI-like protein
MTGLAQPAAPPGFADVGMKGFVGLNGGFLRCEAGDEVRFGFLAEERHCNPMGQVHGGWLSTMADLQLLMQAAHALGLPPSSFVTASLTVQYPAAGRLGDWIESSARLVRRTRTLAFVNGTAMSEDRAVIVMNGVYQIRQD